MGGVAVPANGEIGAQLYPVVTIIGPVYTIAVMQPVVARGARLPSDVVLSRSTALERDATRRDAPRRAAPRRGSTTHEEEGSGAIRRL